MWNDVATRVFGYFFRGWPRKN